ncbi:hypothetical protein [Shewanella litoralis]|nr:hypothetical protein [Shewanella litoralis]
MLRILMLSTILMALSGCLPTADVEISFNTDRLNVEQQYMALCANLKALGFVSDNYEQEDESANKCWMVGSYYIDMKRVSNGLIGQYVEVMFRENEQQSKLTYSEVGDFKMTDMGVAQFEKLKVILTEVVGKYRIK